MLCRLDQWRLNNRKNDGMVDASWIGHQRYNARIARQMFLNQYDAAGRLRRDGHGAISPAPAHMSGRSFR